MDDETTQSDLPSTNDSGNSCSHTTFNDTRIHDHKSTQPFPVLPGTRSVFATWWTEHNCVSRPLDPNPWVTNIAGAAQIFYFSPYPCSKSPAVAFFSLSRDRKHPSASRSDSLNIVRLFFADFPVRVNVLANLGIYREISSLLHCLLAFSTYCLGEKIQKKQTRICTRRFSTSLRMAACHSFCETNYCNFRSWKISCHSFSIRWHRLAPAA